VAVYLSSIGFLSGLAMSLAPGKPLTTVSLIVATYLLSCIPVEEVNCKFSQASVALIAAILLTVFVGLFLDEVGLFSFILFPIIFWPLFWNRVAQPLAKKPDWKGIATCTIPGLLFLVIVVIWIPSFYESWYKQSFDYLGNVFAIGIGSLGAKSIFIGPLGSFGLGVVWHNFANFFGTSLVPIQISPLDVIPVGFQLFQVSNSWQFLGIAAFVVLAGACAATRGNSAAWLRRVLLATAVFIVLVTLLSIRHNPIIIGYYYGASFSLFFALIVGLMLSVVSRVSTFWRLIGVVLAGLIVVVQANNFMYIDELWRTLHYEQIARSIHAAEFKLAPPEVDVSSRELSAIRSAWKDENLDAYLAEHEITVGAIHLVYELRTIDRLRPKSAPR
jgi:hypothetical protein